MFEKLGSFDQVFEHTPDAGGELMHVEPLRRRKTLGQKITFWGANAFLMPLVAVCYLTISAEGLRQMMGIFSMRLYKLPVPGAGLLRNYDGWNRLDLSMLMAILMFGAVSCILIRVFMVLMDSGRIERYRSQNPMLFFLLVTMTGIIVCGDSAIFYFGLKSKATSSWSDTSEHIPAMATVIYMCGLSLIAAYHADYHTSETV